MYEYTTMKIKKFEIVSREGKYAVREKWGIFWLYYDLQGVSRWFCWFHISYDSWGTLEQARQLVYMLKDPKPEPSKIKVVEQHWVV